MFSSNTELGIMEQAYMKLKSQSMSYFDRPRTGQETKESQIRIYNLHKHLARGRLQILIDRKKKRSYRWR
jgi:hypothetical protein